MRFLFLLALACLAAGCATTSGGDPRDPWEGLNRHTFALNDALDRGVLKPTAEAYVKVTTPFVRARVSNFFDNLADLGTGVNDFLQGKPREGINDFGRIVVNTTFGIAGLWDVASQLGVEKRDEDFGQTLGVWGVPNGPYLVIPILGSSTIRDTGGLVVDSLLTPTWYFLDAAVTVGSRVVDTVNSRSILLEDVERARNASFDFYGFVRNAYLSHRASQLHDEGSPRETDESLYFLEEPAK
jgi:phospholipid-binding lipoprotein MlaA